MTIRSPFRPHFGSNQNISPAGVPVSITIGFGSKTLRVRNTGATNVMYFRTGVASEGTVTATTADMPVYPGETVYIEKPQDHTTVSTVSAAGTTASIMSGEGGF